jgi:K+ transporter
MDDLKITLDLFSPLHKCGNLDVLRLGSWNLMISYVIFFYYTIYNNKRLVKTRVVSHYGLAISIEKYLKAKERRIMETQIFHHAKI